MDTNGKNHMLYLEKLLQEIGHQEKKSTLQSVEISSIYEQKTKLENEINQLKGKLSQNLNENTQLYEKVARLNQVNNEKDKELRKLNSELNGNRHTNEALQKNCDSLKSKMENLKENYTKALNQRTNRIILFMNKLIKSNDNIKNKSDLINIIASCKNDSNVETISDLIKLKANDNKNLNITSSLNKNAYENEDINATANTVKLNIDINHDNLNINAKNKTKCIESNNGNHDKNKIKTEMDELRNLQNKTTRELLDNKNLYENKIKNLNLIIEKNQNEIINLKKIINDLESNNNKNNSINTSNVAKHDSRLQLLEENIIQMNAYADSLELILNACQNCRVKLESNINASSSDSNNNLIPITTNSPKTNAKNEL